MAQQLGELVVLPSDQVHFLAPTWHGDSQLSVTRVPGNLKLSLASMGTKHVHGAQTYLQANTHPHKIVRIFLLIKKKRIAGQAILTGMFLSELPECTVYTAGTISHVSGYQMVPAGDLFFSLADGCLLVSSWKRQSSFSYMAIILSGLGPYPESLI